MCCGNSPSMIIENSLKGYRAHCFRNQTHGGFVPKNGLTNKELSEVRSSVNKLTSLSATQFEMPSPLLELTSPTLNDASALKWLLVSGVNITLINLYGIKYQPTTRRVIIPLAEYRTLNLSSNTSSHGLASAIEKPTGCGVLDQHVGWLARKVHKEDAGPKYIIRWKGERTDAIFLSKAEAILHPLDIPAFPLHGNANGLVVTEDVVSAIRVGCTAPACSILGTTCSPEQALHIQRRCSRVFVWLDGDKAGQAGAQHVRRVLRLAGLDVTLVKTSKDPKLYSNREIKEILLDAGYCSPAAYEKPEDI